MGSKVAARRSEFEDPKYFNDRELSWLAFNERVVEEAEDATTPLLERLRFLGIASSNMDEFFMVRVSGVQEQVQARVRSRNLAGMTPEEHFERIHQRAHEQMDRVYLCLRDKVLPALAREDIHLRSVREITRAQRTWLKDYFDREVFPVLTPLAVDSGHPFPHLRNLSLNLAVRLHAPKEAPRGTTLFAIVPVPTVLDRVIRLPERKPELHEYLLLEELIREEIATLFPGHRIKEVCPFRVIRDADLDFAEEEADDLLKTVEDELRRRERGSAVRLGVEKAASADLINQLMTTLGLAPIQVYPFDGPINLTELSAICNLTDRDDLKYPPFTPAVREGVEGADSIFDAISKQDILLHHPFESFAPVLDFIDQAAKDPHVLAVKQTLYRTSGDSPIIKALIAAAEKGKQVAALMELKARFDEARNITFAKHMELSGIHVVYGFVGLKTHAKVCMVVRKEADGIRRYVHIGTGNYNPNTARVYTDLGLLSCDEDLCDDATELFNFLTGYSRNPTFKKIAIAPTGMRNRIVELIDGEIAKARSGVRGRVRAKMNSLADKDIILKLYEASCAGVQIDLIVRGICCLKPGLKGVSENIRVSSIVDRFLEHSRIYIFGDAGEEVVYLASADWMPRNLDRRVEALFPIEAPELKNRVINEIFTVSLSDNVKRRVLQPDGRYTRITRPDGVPPLRSQLALLKIEAGLRDEVVARAQRLALQHPISLPATTEEQETPAPAAENAAGKSPEPAAHARRGAPRKGATPRRSSRPKGASPRRKSEGA